MWGKFLNAGQTCVAPDYVLVDESIKDKLVQAGKAAAITFCSAYLTPVVCTPAVEGLCTLLGI